MHLSRLLMTPVTPAAVIRLVGAIALAGNALVSTLPAWASGSDPGQLAQRSNPAHGSHSAPDEPPLGSRNMDTALEDILILLAEDEPPLGSRARFCAISPGLVGETDVIWSDRPVFVWVGQVSRLTLADFDTNAEVWFADPAATATEIAYPQEPLQPGNLYSWSLTWRDPEGTDQPETDITQTYIFQVMDAAERATLTAEFEALTRELQATGLDPQTQLAEQARFFAEKGLWSDAIQILSQIDTPSDVLGHTLTELTQYICGDRTETPQP